MDLTYYKSRLATSLAAARTALDPCARISHEKMAHSYANLVRAIQKLRNTFEKKPASDLASALDDWENEGGRIAR
jgi:hypothetical protein